ncbi:MAG: LamG domain-containing protein [Gammaproteobacteria bacterium]|jgi:hypothetical protein
MNWPKNTNATGKMPTQTLLRLLGVLLMAITLYGCGGSVENTPAVQTAGSSSCSDASDPVDCEAFRSNVYQPYLIPNCSGCHRLGGNGTGAFADPVVSEAYKATIPNHRINKDDPANSFVVSRVQSGHHCWVNIAGQTETENCADSASLLLTGINKWVNPTGQAQTATNSGGDVVSKLVNPSIDTGPVADPIVLDSTNADQKVIFRDNLFVPILRQRCSNCHSEGAVQAQRQQPYFAQTVATVDEDVDSAFAALVDNHKIDINNPEISRLYLRLAQDSHNCWSDCDANAQEMLNAINDMKTAMEAIAPDPVVEGLQDPNNTTSQALALDQGQVVSGGTRVTSGLVALWEFKEGTGNVAHDSSGVSPLIDLVLNDNTDWVGGWGIEFKDGGSNGVGNATASSIDDSKKLHDNIVSQNAFTIEGWVVPANVTQVGDPGPAIIASYSFSPTDRNFSMGQRMYSYEFLNRNTASGEGIAGRANGLPSVITNPDDEDLQATQQHVVMTYDGTNGRRIYVNGELTNVDETVAGGSLAEWDDGYVFTLGSDVGGANPWLGKIRLLAIYNRALTQEEISQNFDAGVGQKFQLLFKVGHLSDNIPDSSYIWFEVGEFDDYSYLFANPQFVVLDPNSGSLNPTSINSVDIQGMRIGINGKIPSAGQAFLKMNATVSMPDLTDTANPRAVPLIDTADGVRIDGNLVDNVPIKATGTIIAKVRGPNGPAPDQFYLTFENFDGAAGVQTDNGTPIALGYSYPDPDTNLPNTNYIAGIRNFEEINATMSALTGVPITDSAVQSVFLGLQQQLPSGPELQGFLASHQMGISKLAFSYCGVLVDTKGGTFFPNFELNQPVDTAFSNDTKKGIVVDALYNNFIINNLSSQPSRTNLWDALFKTGAVDDPNRGLYQKLYDSCEQDASCVQDDLRTKKIVKAMCVSVLSSAAVTTQ